MKNKEPKISQLIGLCICGILVGRHQRRLEYGPRGVGVYEEPKCPLVDRMFEHIAVWLLDWEKSKNDN